MKVLLVSHTEPLDLASLFETFFDTPSTNSGTKLACTSRIYSFSLRNAEILFRFAFNRIIPLLFINFYQSCSKKRLTQKKKTKSLSFSRFPNFSDPMKATETIFHLYFHFTYCGLWIYAEKVRLNIWRSVRTIFYPMVLYGTLFPTKKKIDSQNACMQCTHIFAFYISHSSS